MIIHVVYIEVNLSCTRFYYYISRNSSFLLNLSRLRPRICSRVL